VTIAFSNPSLTQIRGRQAKILARIVKIPDDQWIGSINLSKPLMTSKRFTNVCSIVLVCLAVQTQNVAGAPPTARPASDPSPQNDGAGAYGTIQPRSRVITLSHDNGMEGVRVDKLLIKEGDDVKAGQLIATFSDLVRRKEKLAAAQIKEKRIQASLNGEKANLIFLQQEHGRLDGLRQKMAVTPSQLGGAKRDMERSQHAVEALNFELTESALVVALAENEVEQGLLRSPMNATVLEILIRPGERSMNEGIVKIGDLSAFDVVAEVYERDIRNVKVGQKVQVLLQASSTTYSGKVSQVGYLVKKGSLFYPDPALDRDERIIEVRAQLDNAIAPQLKHMVNAEVRVRFQ
jgi:HlyD family secretion protein